MYYLENYLNIPKHPLERRSLQLLWVSLLEIWKNLATPLTRLQGFLLICAVLISKASFRLLLTSEFEEPGKLEIDLALTCLSEKSETSWVEGKGRELLDWSSLWRFCEIFSRISKSTFHCSADLLGYFLSQQGCNLMNVWHHLYINCTKFLHKRRVVVSEFRCKCLLLFRWHIWVEARFTNFFAWLIL